MIEIIESTIQLITTSVCTGIALHQAISSGKRAWVLLALSSGVFFLGDLYWTLFLVFYFRSPRYSYISEFSWYAAYLFLLTLLFEIRGERKKMPFRPPMLLIPAFTVGMAVFFLRWGDWPGNILTAVLMGFLMWHATEGLLIFQKDQRFRTGESSIYLMILLFCLTEYTSWVASCFWMGDTLKNPYFWSDTLLSVIFLLLPGALKKAVEG